MYEQSVMSSKWKYSGIAIDELHPSSERNFKAFTHPFDSSSSSTEKKRFPFSLLLI